MDQNYQFFMNSNVEQYVGKWIAINNDKIIASGTNVKSVIEKAKKLNPSKKPFVTKVPEKTAMIF